METNARRPLNAEAGYGKEPRVGPGNPAQLRRDRRRGCDRRGGPDRRREHIRRARTVGASAARRIAVCDRGVLVHAESHPHPEQGEPLRRSRT